MHVWYLNHYAGGPGIGKFMRAYHLGCAWVEAGHETTVFVAQYHHQLESHAGLAPENIVNGVRYVALPARRYEGNGVGRLLNMADYCFSAFRLAWRRDIDPPDVVIASSPHPFAVVPAWWLARRHRAKLVFEMRDIWPLSVVEINGTSAWHPFVIVCGMVERFAYRVSDLVGSLLAGAHEHIQTIVQTPPNFVYVPNGTNTGKFVGAKPTSTFGAEAFSNIEAWRREGRLIVIHPGAQGVPNALDRLLNAISFLKEQGVSEELGVMLVGEGRETNKLKAFAVERALDNVVFCPTVPYEEAVWLIRHSDVGYAGARDIPSVYRYGISFNKIMDFMQAALPIILPIKASYNPVSDAQCGIVTGSDRARDIADAILSLKALTPAQRAEMGERGRRYAAQVHDYDRIAANYIVAIERA